MPGFPTRPSRLAFGPLSYENRFEVQEPNKEVGASIFNLDYWQVAGCGIMVPIARAQLVIDNAGDETLGFSAEAWDAEQGVVPTLSKQATGVYRVTYAATYPDEAGEAIAVQLLDADAHVQFTAAAQVKYFAWCQVLANLREIDVHIATAAAPGTPADPIDQNIVVVAY